MSKVDSPVFTLSKKSVIALFCYYALLVVIGGVVSIYITFHLTDEITQAQLIKYTFISSIAVGEMLCGIQYIKRLYKACLTDRIISSDESFKTVGNIAYFLLRPLFSFAFVIITVFSLLSGMFIITGSLDYILNNKFLYLCVILSSYVGFSTGKVLDKFEAISNKRIDNI